MDEKQYIAYSAILVAEVLSKSTRAYDAFDKFLQYKKLPQLRYFLMIEPFKKIITLDSKNDHNEWLTEYFREPDEIINLSTLNISFKLSDLYK